MADATGESAQRRALTRAFLARFFENEITRGSNDLKASFSTLVASLALPGALLPAFLGAWDWSMVGSVYGFEYLRDYTLGDKTLIVGLGMVVTTFIGALVWNSVLLDRRDALIIGALPARARTVVRAKLLAVATYIAIVAAALHGATALLLGTLFSPDSFAYALTGVVAHFSAGFLASVFVMLTIAASQALLLLAAGPRRFRRWSAALQVVLVGAAVLLFLWLPAIADAARNTYRNDWPSDWRRPVADRTADHVWLRWMPPVWFLGVYETIIPPSRPQTLPLAATAVAGLGVLGLVALVGLPMAYRRVMVSGVEEPEGFGRTGAAARLGEVWTRAVSRQPARRASSQFLLAAVGRVDRQRFVLALALGAAVAWVLPTVVRWLTLIRDPPARPEGGLLQLPYAVMICVLLGLRVAAALPASLPAGWILTLTDGPPGTHRRVLRRTMLGLGVLPGLVVLLPVYWQLWGVDLAVTHAALVLGVGLLLVNLLLWGFDGMPCGSAWTPVNARLRLLWPVYLLAFGIYTQLWRFSVPLAQRPTTTVLVVTTLAGVAMLLDYAGRRTIEPARYDMEQDAAALQVLNLD